MRTFLAQGLLATAALVPAALFAQHAFTSDAPEGKMTPAKKINIAMSAAPMEIAKNATIMDWPEKEGAKPKQLRAGTNGWVCFPNSPTEYSTLTFDDPVCMDKQWQAWGEAWMSKKPPKVVGTGIAYKLKGDRGASNTDPFATAPTPTNNWVISPPHIMVLYADLKLLDAFSTDPTKGGPWVMWKGTPYAHLMVPVSPNRVPVMGRVGGK